jgi:hypothetical protein
VKSIFCQKMPSSDCVYEYAAPVHLINNSACTWYTRKPTPDVSTAILLVKLPDLCSRRLLETQDGVISHLRCSALLERTTEVDTASRQSSSNPNGNSLNYIETV